MHKKSIKNGCALFVALTFVYGGKVWAQAVESGQFTFIDQIYNYQVIQGDFANSDFKTRLEASFPYANLDSGDAFVNSFFVTYPRTQLFNTYTTSSGTEYKKSAFIYGQSSEWKFIAHANDAGIGKLNEVSYYPSNIPGTYSPDHYWILFAPVLGPLAVDTLNSFRPNAFALRNTFNLQSANITQSLSYDCTVFDAKNICASFTGTRSDQSGSNLDSTTGTLVIAHRPAANVRFGGYINQSLNTSEQGGLRLERSKPGMGAFVNYAMTTGLNIRGSVSFGKMDMQTTREVIESAEAGVGKSNITTQGAQLELSKAFDIKAGWTAVPYAGIRKVTNKRAAYSEIESEAVSAPLTYVDLKQTQTTAFGGMRFLGQIAQQTQLLISAGVEHDSSRKVDDYAASGIDDLGSITMQENVKKTRPVFTTSLSYDIAKNERASIGVVHRQEAYDKKRTTSVGFTYIKGF